jgi:GNAT superfamily N-acetyltransferase
MIIRQLTNDDIPKAMELKILCWTEELAGQAENSMQLKEEIDFWTDWLNTPDEHNDIRVFIGAFENLELLGVAAGSFIDSKDSPQNGIELNGLWVFPEFRGKGISLKMILYILDFFIPLGVTRLEVYNPHHAPSNAYYKKFGGTVIDTEYQEDGKVLVDVFEFDTLDFKTRLERTLLSYS